MRCDFKGMALYWQDKGPFYQCFYHCLQLELLSLSYSGHYGSPLLESVSSSVNLSFQISFGTRHQFNSADTYHHLLLEGHMVLRSAVIGQTLKEGEESDLNDLMSESCALLGDFYAL